MNPKIRALLWEELRVSGAIASTCAVVALAGQWSLRIGGYGFWHAVSEMVLTITLGVPVLMGLLFTFSTGNSGHLAGGFSRRILRLPVDAWSTVLIVLATRLIEMLLVSAFLVGTCWILYGHGPGPRVVFLLAGIYLTIQILDWMRAVAAMIAWTIVAAISISFLVQIRGVSAWTDILALPGGVTPLFLLGFAFWVLLAYGLSLLMVHWTRSGERSSLLSAPSFDTLISLPARERRKPFRSALSAQIWFEMRRAGLFLPTAVLVFWLAALIIFWIGTSSVGTTGHSHVSVANNTEKLRAYGVETLPRPDTVNMFWPLEVWPFVGLLFASFGWGVWFASRHRGTKRSSRPATFIARQPLTKARMAQARLVVAGVNLGLVLVVLGIVSTLSFLYTDHALVLRMLYEALTHHETSLREIVQIVIGPTLLVGLIAWVIMSSGVGSLRAVILIGYSAITLMVAHAQSDGSPPQASLYALGLLGSWIAVLFPIVWLAQSLCTLLWKGILSRKSFLVCILLWCAIALAIFPFSFAQVGRERPAPLFVSFALSALLVLPYASTTQSLSRREPRERLTAQNPAQHHRLPPASNRWRVAMAVGAVALLAALAWMRWPAEAAWKAAWRSQGLPTNLEELNTWYAPVPTERNLAVRYLQASDKMTALEGEWNTYLQGLRQGADSSFIDDGLLVVGQAHVERTEQVPSDAWKLTKEYWDTVSSKVCPDLHAIAQSGLTESRYPIDVRRGPALELPHNVRFRTLARQLSVEAWVASVERRPDAAVDAVLDTYTFANSLKDEPIFISQLVRIAIIGMAQGSLEVAMNRVVLSEDDLKRLQEGLSRVLPPIHQGLLIDRGMIGEEVMALDSAARYGTLVLSDPPWLSRTDQPEFSFIESLPADAMLQIGDLLGYEIFQRLFVIRRHAILRDWAHESARLGRIQYLLPEDGFWTPHLWPRVFLAVMMMPALERAYDSEWRVRTQLDLARTAVAVERFRLAHGRLPQQLDALVPAFLDRVPGDFYNEGRPLSYRIKDTGEYVVYSYGPNRQDDNGVKHNEYKGWDIEDIPFAVVPPELRERPQVAPAM